MTGFEDKLTDLAFILIGVSTIRVLLVLVGQTWIKTMAHTGTIFVLPVITYVITNVIAGNIALSLGMVGALSIVRFRNPVRSPLELSAYFAAITIGIAASVDTKWLIFLIAALIAITLVLSTLNVVIKKLTKRAFFVASFTEGNSRETLEIASKQLLQIETADIELIFEAFDGANYTQIYSSHDQEILKSKIRQVASDSNLISYKISR
jgi:hypothetical protein